MDKKIVKWVLVGLVAFYTFEGFSFFSSKRFKFLCGLPSIQVNLDGQKLVFDFVKWVLVGLVAFYTFEGFSFFSSKRFKFLCGLPTISPQSRWTKTCVDFVKWVWLIW
jgi:hypothetical protein